VDRQGILYERIYPRLPARIAMKITCPISDPVFAEHPLHGQKAQQNLIRRAVSYCQHGHRRMAVDVGAHIGLCSLELALTFDSVVAFEPVEENFKCLVDNTRFESGVMTFDVALGNSRGMCRFVKHNNNNSGCWQLGSTLRRLPASATVFMDTLDSYNFGAVDFLKIDVEGLEGEVIQGAADTIRASKPVILFEDNDLGPQSYGKAWINPRAELTELGYRKVERINKDEVWCYR
jgi:FkbM family methyltransferase